jgi:hypothetical protein
MLIDTARARFRSHPIGLRSRLRDIRRALHPLHWDGRRRFLAEYLREAGIPYRPAMLWPLLRYDAKHWFKDRVYGRKTWLTGEPKRAASKPAGSEGVDKPGKE